MHTKQLYVYKIVFSSILRVIPFHKSIHNILTKVVSYCKLGHIFKERNEGQVVCKVSNFIYDEDQY